MCLYVFVRVHVCLYAFLFALSLINAHLTRIGHLHACQQLSAAHKDGCSCVCVFVNACGTCARACIRVCTYMAS